MRLWHLLTTFKGRIGRKAWWTGLIVYAILNIGGGLILNPEYFTAEVLPPANMPDTIWQAILLIPLAAITAKRGNDRDWPAWIAPTFVAANAFNLAAPHLGLEIGAGVPGAGGIVFAILAIFVLTVFVDNGFVRGTQGPNRHGDDPLAHTA